MIGGRLVGSLSTGEELQYRQQLFSGRGWSWTGQVAANAKDRETDVLRLTKCFHPAAGSDGVLHAAHRSIFVLAAFNCSRLDLIQDATLSRHADKRSCSVATLCGGQVPKTDYRRHANALDQVNQVSCQQQQEQN